MKDKLVIGVVSLLLGALILVSLLMPWWSESLGIFFGKFTFYPFSIPRIPIIDAITELIFAFSPIFL